MTEAGVSSLLLKNVQDDDCIAVHPAGDAPRQSVVDDAQFVAPGPNVGRRAGVRHLQDFAAL
jgi:hypothetical protein